ncbi:hypothetical protein [Methylobacterium soli]|uniref:Uncharacterized protein n=1 Tax=Methylobacterium soli TaxID=553447 RepID=A0A6L3T5R5_9HYPH|nr:hypothetical protein [Methylobacterium soli]KAB1078713.1 hypothetical protein F6X53_13585 [Methylobacterium soli]GJE42196.1 hypothetical protein AEGHOMDF_1367 [Methylobacterium soli]
MLLTALLALTTLLPQVGAGLDAARRSSETILSFPASAPVTPAMPRFAPEARAVTNWRQEAGATLRPASLALVVRLSTIDPPFVARCVKLNNYWCIKRARWSGEIGADAEGHTGFATAAEGADAAALLLRRYYRDYGRRTALAIVRRWAPATCGLPNPVAATGAGGHTQAVSATVAPMGLGRTLRARFLARQGRGGTVRSLAFIRAKGPALHRPALRIQPWSPLARMAAGPRRPVARAIPATRQPEIGILSSAKASIAADSPRRTGRPSGAADPSALLSRPSLAPDRLVAESAALPAIAAGLPLLDLRLPAPLCSGDDVRIGNYAARIASSVGLKPGDDLKLFSADGNASPNLAPVMLAMSGVELGTLKAGPDLVDAAIRRLDAGRDRASTTAEVSQPPE